jgi:hypothetical protein
MVLDEWGADEDLSAAKLNQPVNAIKQLRAGGPHGSGGSGVPGIRPLLARIVAAGPRGVAGGDDDWYDARYWCELVVSRPHTEAGTGSENQLLVFGRNRHHSGDGSPEIVAATNLSEYYAGPEPTDFACSHGLRPGTLVLLFPVFPATGTSWGAARQYVFCGGRRDAAPVKITGSASGGGKYVGQLLHPVLRDTDIPAAGDLTEAEIRGGDLEEIRIINSREVGKSTHDLASSAFLPLIFIGTFIKVADDGVAVYMIDGAQQEDCS